MVQNVNLTNHFLIAMPSMADDNFSRSLVYVAEHNEEGALGIIVNRPLELSVKELLERVEITPQAEGLDTAPVFFGGPVQTDRGFVLHRPIGGWQSSLQVTAEIALTSSKDILQALAESGEPRDVLITLGYSGWSAGQLEDELKRKAWLTHPASLELVFDAQPEQLWQRILRQKGWQYQLLSQMPEDPSVN